MQNKKLIKAAQDILKDLLSKCTIEQQLLFKRMYAKGNLDLDINSVVDNMDTTKMDWAITQCEKSIKR